MKEQIRGRRGSYTRKTKLRRAVTTECKMIRGSWLQRQKEKQDESQSLCPLTQKQTHSSEKTNYFLDLDSKRNLLWRTVHKVHEYVYLTQISSTSYGIYLSFREVNFRAQQVDSVSSNLQCQCAVKQLLPILLLLDHLSIFDQIGPKFQTALKLYPEKVLVHAECLSGLPN